MVPDRAADACEKSMDEGRVSETMVRDVLRRSDDGERFVRFLASADSVTRGAAARMAAAKGPLEELVKAALVEKDRGLLLDMMRLLASRGGRVEALAGYLSSEDRVVREAAVEAFRKAGLVEHLFPFVFDSDDVVVERTKRYMNEKGKG